MLMLSIHQTALRKINRILCSAAVLSVVCTGIVFAQGEAEEYRRGMTFIETKVYTRRRIEILELYKDLRGRMYLMGWIRRVYLILD